VSSRKIILLGLLSSLLLIFLCISFNAEKYFNELNVENEKPLLPPTPTLVLKDHIESIESKPKEIIVPVVAQPQEQKTKIIATEIIPPKIETPIIKEVIHDHTIIDIVNKSEFNKTKTIPKILTLEEMEKEIATLLKNEPINFQKNSEALTQEAQNLLNKVVILLKNRDDVMVEIQGHTDAGGKKRVNYFVSKMRANKVKEYLINQGFKNENIIAKGFGESKPLVQTAPFDKVNRRVEIHLKRK